jgi:cobalt-zinc-cadmium efflux system membrane fusion protein
MNKQILLIPLVLALAAFGAWRILGTKPSPKTGHDGHGDSEHGGHADEGHDDHGGSSRIELSPEAIKHAAIAVEEAAPAVIEDALAVYGKIAANEEAIAHVMPRFPGLVRDVRKRLGDPVDKGDVLAVIESNESLRSYEIRSEIRGTVIAKDISLGEAVPSDKKLFIVADLSTVWVDLTVFRRDFSMLRAGQAVTIQTDDREDPIRGVITYISPFGMENTQSALARAEIPNLDGSLRPGLFVTARIVTRRTEVPVAVRNPALQTVGGKVVVFAQSGDAFEMREVETGATDAERTEILSGLLPGESYASRNSFVLKADLGKSEAEHEH